MPTTLDNIRDRAKDLLELEDSNFLDATQWASVVNDALRELWSFILTRAPEALSTSEDQSISSTATNSWALPSGFRRTLIVERDPGETTRRNLGRTSVLRKNYSRQPSLSYWLDGSRIYVEPLERSVGDYRHYYVGSVTELSSGSDQVDTQIEPWAREWCAIRAAIKGRIREQESIAELRDRMRELQAEVAADVTSRAGQLPRGMVRTLDEPVDWRDR